MKDIVIKYQEVEDFSLLSDLDRELMKKAKDIANTAYSPYSEFNVGAALFLENNKFVVGNNQENSSFPCGICAERVALFTAGTNYPNVLIKKIAITLILFSILFSIVTKFSSSLKSSLKVRSRSQLNHSKTVLYSFLSSFITFSLSSI